MAYISDFKNSVKTSLLYLENERHFSLLQVPYSENCVVLMFQYIYVYIYLSLYIYNMYIYIYIYNIYIVLFWVFSY